MQDTGLALFAVVILVVGIILIYSVLARIAFAVEKIAKALEEDGDDDDGGGKKLIVPITGPREIKGTRCDVVDIATDRKRAADDSHRTPHEDGYGHGV